MLAQSCSVEDSRVSLVCEIAKANKQKALIIKADRVIEVKHIQQRLVVAVDACHATHRNLCRFNQTIL